MDVARSEIVSLRSSDHAVARIFSVLAARWGEAAAGEKSAACWGFHAAQRCPEMVRARRCAPLTALLCARGNCPANQIPDQPTIVRQRGANTLSPPVPRTDQTDSCFSLRRRTVAFARVAQQPALAKTTPENASAPKAIREFIANSTSVVSAGHYPP
jgi:hypothetical protein